MRKEIADHRPAIWGDVLAILAHFQDTWPDVGEQLKPCHSLGDFSVFGAGLCADSERAKWEARMKRLDKAQARFTSEENPLVEVILAMLKDAQDGRIKMTSSEFHEKAKAQSGRLNLAWPYKNNAALTRSMKEERSALEQHLNACVSVDNHHQARATWITIQPKPATQTSAAGLNPEGDEGDDGDLAFCWEKYEAQAA
ncbi:hypothetical protein YTPLAS18_33790 [Nitrospira sp.]|nr:hypothetical protein YTPLAS18_33790 [Nitrospira sp.]